MNRFEDEFKYKIGDQRLSNEDFDTDGLWDDINEELNEDSKPKVGFTRLFLWAALLLVGLSIVGVFYINDSGKDGSDRQQIEGSTKDEIENKHENQNFDSSSMGEESLQLNEAKKSSSAVVESTEKVEVIDRLETTSADTKQSESLFSLESSDDTESVSGVAEDTRTPSFFDERIDLKTSQQSKDDDLGTTKEIDATKQSYGDQIMEEERLSTNPINGYAPDLAKKNGLDNRRSDQESISVSSSENVEVNIRSSSKAVERGVIPTPVVLSQKEVFIVTNSSIEAYEPLAIVDAPSVEKAKGSWELIAWTGINSTNLNFNSSSLPDYVELKNQFEINDQGLSFGLAIAKDWNDKFMVSSGIDYHKLWTKFDYESSDSVKVAKQDQLVKVWIDRTTGDTIRRINEDVIVNGVTTRKVLHHNQYRRISIPLSFGVQHRSQKMAYGVSIGATFNFTISQSGRALDISSEVVDFDNTSSASVFEPFSIGLRLDPFIGYQVSDHISLKLHPQWNWMSRSGFDASDISVTVHQLNLNVSVGYRLD